VFSTRSKPGKYKQDHSAVVVCVSSCWKKVAAEGGDNSGIQRLPLKAATKQRLVKTEQTKNTGVSYSDVLNVYNKQKTNSVTLSPQANNTD
jgi:hypothetical protein